MTLRVIQGSRCYYTSDNSILGILFLITVGSVYYGGDVLRCGVSNWGLYFMDAPA